MKWVFAKNDGGRDSGLHDAGLETFKGNFERYMARELLQNSLDARLDLKKPVHVKFELLELRRSQLPGMSDLQKTLDRCAEYWKTHEKAHVFFSEASKLAAEPKLTVLKVGDHNTTGVPGDDNDRDKNWYHLIRCAGSSSKTGGEGGSFGIGKNAPFAASRLHTVYYSTRTTDGDVAFQGVSILASHELADGSTAQPTGFLGGDHGESILQPGLIPNVLRRKKSGLDIIVLGYPAASTWQNDFVYSVLDNFWPAIDFGDLTVTIGDQKIHRVNLPDLLNQFAAQEDFTAHRFYEAYKAPSHRFSERLSTIHECALHVTAGDMELPRRVAMVRSTGMVIYKRSHIRSLLPFCGVFLCRNEVGNKVLREMEPPRHDTWDADHPERGANKKVEREYMKFIRDSIRKLVLIDDLKVISIPDLNRFLPDDDEADEESFDGSDSTSIEETAERSPLPEVIPGRTIDQRRQLMQPDGMGNDEDDEETEAGEGEGTGGRSTEGENDADGGTGAGGGGKGDGNAAPETGGAEGTHSKPAVPVQYRTFARGVESGVYSLIVKREQPGPEKLNLTVLTVGDDQKVPAEIVAAFSADGHEIPLAGTGLLGPLALPDDVAERIEITLSEPIRVAMEVSAHEA